MLELSGWVVICPMFVPVILFLAFWAASLVDLAGQSSFALSWAGSLVAPVTTEEDSLCFLGRPLFLL